MASNFSSDTDGPIAAINVTPLVDVMLVLLVIFMVTAPMLQQGVEVDLPKATTAPLRGSSEQIVISLDKAGTIFIGAGNKVELSVLPEKIKAIFANKPPEDHKVYIKGDVALGCVLYHGAGSDRKTFSGILEDIYADRRKKRAGKYVDQHLAIVKQLGE